ncbi:Acyl-CoA thioesterase 2 [Ceratocystis fimbriata CBS 114723]|uniref:Acyl-CoA thioesterase 2 n=1 Tax=Ceratocystis fimbriata CBS 114723 TaxID=1035309 RepID=A0A2C5X855_9PEZI|nr:Acyl-CoA thioesterase 2 [Ceratocystis fimbriata CBS 114723]
MAPNGTFSKTGTKFNAQRLPPDSVLQEQDKETRKATLLRPQPEDPTKAPIENTLEIQELSQIEPDIFTNARPLWHPPTARGIFGGGVIAQSIAAGQSTVPPDFAIHSCHSYFLLAGSSTIPLVYHVERVRDGRSFATRTVQACQRGACIFTITASFVRRSSGGTKSLRHALPTPQKIGDAPPVPTNDEDGQEDDDMDDPALPFIVRAIRITGTLDAPGVHQRRCQHWMKARGKISTPAGSAEHVAALAYMSDSAFVASVLRIHGVWRFHSPPEAPAPEYFRRAMREDVGTDGKFNGLELSQLRERPRMGMLVSLDHSIYFHNPQAVKADEWMLSDVMSPFSGDGRGVAISHIYSQDGTLLATCVQEGVTRLNQDGPDPVNPDFPNHVTKEDKPIKEKL